MTPSGKDIADMSKYILNNPEAGCAFSCNYGLKDKLLNTGTLSAQDLLKCLETGMEFLFGQMASYLLLYTRIYYLKQPLTIASGLSNDHSIQMALSEKGSFVFIVDNPELNTGECKNFKHIESNPKDPETLVLEISALSYQLKDSMEK
jgi:hypothetical protein